MGEEGGGGAYQCWIRSPMASPWPAMADPDKQKGMQNPRRHRHPRRLVPASFDRAQHAGEIPLVRIWLTSMQIRGSPTC